MWCIFFTMHLNYFECIQIFSSNEMHVTLGPERATSLIMNLYRGMLESKYKGHLREMSIRRQLLE